MDSRVQLTEHSVMYGEKTIDFQLLYAERKTLEIAVHPDLTIVVKAPRDSDIALIESKVKKRARWIRKHQNYFRQFIPRTTDRFYINGETHLYLGKQYRLKISKGISDSVKLSRGFFHLNHRSDQSPDSIKKIFDKWYFERAKLHFPESLDRCWPKFKHMGIRKPKLMMRRMKKRWGSFSEPGTVILNTDLIRAPKECIDYVVFHELCHLKYPNHGPEFFTLLEAVLPGWERIKHRLEMSLA